nr:hypothetical protein [uncultured Mediterraneibacter sp.]
MKKTIIGMVVGMMIMICVGFVGFTAISKQHETDIANLKSGYETQISELNKKNTNTEKSYDDLEEQVYNMMDGKNYKIEINHKNEKHTYTKTGNGWFRKQKHTVTK